MSKHLLWIVAALVLGLSALLSSTPVMAHGDHSAATKAATDCAPPTASRADADGVQAAVASNGTNDDSCPCCPTAGHGCCAATVGLSPTVSDALRPMSGAFRLGRDAAVALATAFYPLDEPPASA